MAQFSATNATFGPLVQTPMFLMVMFTRLAVGTDVDVDAGLGLYARLSNVWLAV